MKKILRLLPFFIFFHVFSYLEREAWEKMKREGQVSEDVRSRLDDLFKNNESLRRVFADQAMKIPVFVGYQVQPNKHYPGTYKKDVHLWENRLPKEQVDVINLTEQKKREFNEIISSRNAILADAHLKNLSEVNLAIRLEQPPCILRGTSFIWSTFPHVVSRYVNARLWQKHFDENGFNHIRIPETKLYHIPDTPEDLNDCNWAVIQEEIKNPLSWEELVEEVSKPELSRHKVFNELNTLFDPEKQNPLWDSIFRPKEDSNGKVVGAEKLDILFQRENGELYAYCIDTEGPSIAGEQADEKRSVDFNDKHPLMYGPYSDSSRSWSFLMEVIKKIKSSSKK